MIEIKDLIKIFLDEETNTRVPALRGCDLTVKKGEIITIIGPSGSGKTTLVNIIAGLETYSSGYVRVGDYDLENLKTKALNTYRLKMIGIVDQFPERTLFLDGTIEDNMNFLSNIKNRATKEDYIRNASILEKLGIDHLKSRIVRGLSGGEMIRTAIACALAKKAPVLLCDEPTGQLDSLNTTRVKELLKQVSRDFGTAILVVTHDPRFQEGVDRTCEIRDGRVSSIINLSEQDAFDDQKKFPLKFNSQIDSTSSIRLPDLVVDTLQLEESVEVQLSKKGMVKLRHPNKIKPKEVILEDIKLVRKELVMEELSENYFSGYQPAIELKDVSKIYQSNGSEVHALTDINLKLNKGELLFILGPSGSGKTTLVKLITGLEKISLGELTILNELFSNFSDAEKSTFRRENIGLVSQQGNLHPFLTVTENFYLKDIFSGKIFTDISSESVNDYLTKFNIEHRSESFPLEISGGELQRASLAIANNNYPPIIILDEPTANLDSDLAEQAIEQIYKLHQTTDITFLIATHDINIIKDGMRALELEDGKIKRDGIVVSSNTSD